MSVVERLPYRASLANVRKQAKALLVAWRAGDQSAVSRVRDLHPRGEQLLADGRSCLADAQLIMARGYGFASWARLVGHLRLAPRARALARCGARVDNIVFAAAVGDLAQVADHLHRERRRTADQPRSGWRIGVGGPRLDPDHMIEYALIYSAGLGRRAVVELLLSGNPDLSVAEPRFHSTARGMAHYHHRHDVLALLEPPIRARDQ